ncbi:MAG: deoxyribose-phosphate aldolase [Gammaproteobacteria bacterium]
MSDSLQTLIGLLDLTSLNPTDDNIKIQQLCQQAITPLGKVAAVCIYPQFVSEAQAILQGTDVKIATVSNFPEGNQPLAETLIEIEQALKAGADEIDLVMPYQAFLQGEYEAVQNFLATCKSACEQHTLKVILETGALQSPEHIATASQIAIEAGADFLKTSTGKLHEGATLKAAEEMLRVIRTSDSEVGFKAAGGIRTIEQAQAYITLAQDLLGEDWVEPYHFRLGTSQLLNEILQGNAQFQYPD